VSRPSFNGAINWKGGILNEQQPAKGGASVSFIGVEELLMFLYPLKWLLPKSSVFVARTGAERGKARGWGRSGKFWPYL